MSTTMVQRQTPLSKKPLPSPLSLSYASASAASHGDNGLWGNHPCSPPVAGAVIVAYGANTSSDENGGIGWMSTRSSIVSWVNGPSSSTRPRRARIAPSTTIADATYIKRGWPMANWPFSLPCIINFARNSLALDGCKSSKATLQPPKPVTQQSNSQ